MRDVVYTTLPEVTKPNVTTDKLHLIAPSFVPRPHAQVLFNESMKNSFSLKIDSWTKDKRAITTGTECQLDIGSSVKVNSSKYFIAAHQSAARSGVANKETNVTIFHVVDGLKLFVEIEGTRYGIPEILLRSIMLPLIISIKTEGSRNFMNNMLKNHF